MIILEKQFSKKSDKKLLNIAGRLPENSRNSFVDLQSPINSKRDRPKNSLKAYMLYFDYRAVFAASISCSQITFI